MSRVNRSAGFTVYADENALPPGASAFAQPAAAGAIAAHTLDGGKAGTGQRRHGLTELSQNRSNADNIARSSTFRAAKRPLSRSLLQPQPQASAVVEDDKMPVSPMRQSPLRNDENLPMSPSTPLNGLFGWGDGSTDVLDSVDAKNLRNPQYVSEYARDVIGIWLHMEKRNSVDYHYMSKQQHINTKMRGILVDWLVEVHLKFKLLPETLYVCVFLVDRYLEKVVVQRSRLQLVGIVAMLVACKYQEIYPPSVEDFVYISDQAYTKAEIISYEECLLATLDFKVTSPTALGFAQRWMQVLGAESLETMRLISYLQELSLVDYQMLTFSPSILSAAATVLALTIEGRSIAHTDLERHSGYSHDDLLNCFESITELIRNSGQGKLRAVHRKYSHHKYGKVAQKAAEYVKNKDLR